jgi:type IV secretory pathway VirB4 component
VGIKIFDAGKAQGLTEILNKNPHVYELCSDSLHEKIRKRVQKFKHWSNNKYLAHLSKLEVQARKAAPTEASWTEEKHETKLPVEAIQENLQEQLSDSDKDTGTATPAQTRKRAKEELVLDKPTSLLAFSKGKRGTVQLLPKSPVALVARPAASILRVMATSENKGGFLLTLLCCIF